MRIRRRSLRKLLVAAGCVVGHVHLPEAGVGGLVLVFGAALHLWSKGCLEQNRNLTTVGPYRWTRNPFYLANLLIDLGLCLVIGSFWLAAVFWPLWWVAYRDTIRREESRLLELFPDTYPDYVAAVPRLIPTGRAWPADRAAGHFSWQSDALLRGAEYARLFGVLLSVGVVWAAELVRREHLALFDAEHRWILGVLVLVLVGWIVKLALAETFRRPGTRLLPGEIGSIGRRIVTVLGVGVLLTCAGGLNRIETGVALGFGLAVLAVWPSRDAPLGGSLALHIFVGLLSLVVGALSGWLWLAGVPILWCTLAALDAVGEMRARAREGAERRVWRPLRFLGVADLATGTRETRT